MAAAADGHYHERRLARFRGGPRRRKRQRRRGRGL